MMDQDAIDVNGNCGYSFMFGGKKVKFPGRIGLKFDFLRLIVPTLLLRLKNTPVT